MKFYTSDLHFDHSNMLEYEHRPWANVESMNEGLLYRINGRVRLNDELYILGDFTLRSTRSAVEKFRNGIICNHVHLITGNHDYFAKRKWKAAGLELPTVVFWNVDARSDNVPATKFDRNVTLISGSNQSAFRFAMEGKTPEQLMHEVIDSDRYKQIKA